MNIPKKQRSNTFYIEKEKDLNSSALVPFNNLKNSKFEENSYLRRSNRNKSPYNIAYGRREPFSKNEINQFEKIRIISE